MRTIEKTVAADRETVWRLWTTPDGIGQWWAPDGFRTDVDRLDLRVGGELVSTMTATAPEAVAFLEQNGLPLSTTSRKTFAELAEPSRIAYDSTIDFVPGEAPYEHRTVVDLEPVEGGTHVLMQVEPLHDEVWTERLLAGRANELENLARLVG
jgi:uncharacterized protein YndB with AHSA1/START domain